MSIASRPTTTLSFASVPPQSSVVAPVDERRCATRERLAFPVRVTTMGRSAALQCQGDDISEAGMFMRAPNDAGLCVGQRCEVNFEDDSSGRLAGLVGGTWFATVVRTERSAGHAGDQVGAGLRFDQPLFL